jgi:hypothetical protein
MALLQAAYSAGTAVRLDGEVRVSSSMLLADATKYLCKDAFLQR